MSSATGPSPRQCKCGAGKPEHDATRAAGIEQLVANNKEWVASVNAHDPQFFDKLSPQDPKYLYIGCADARVDPSRVLGLKHGELFVHRNVGNCCSYDLNFLAVLEYAVSFLKVPHIIVCGHYDCGAVRNADKVQDIGLLENWLRQIRDVRRLHADELSRIGDAEAKHKRMVELNVLEQARNVMKAACVQRRRFQDDSTVGFTAPQVHAMVFDTATGLVKSLDSELTPPADDIYNLFEAAA